MRIDRVTILLKITLLIISVSLLVGCTKPESEKKALTAANSKGVAMIKEVKDISGYSPSYLVSNNELAFVRSDNHGTDIFIINGDKERKVISGNNPSLSKAGLFYIDGGEVFLKEEGDNALNLGLHDRLKSIDAVAASPSGNMLVIVNLIGDGADSASELYLYEIKTKKLSRILDSDISASDPSWVGEDKIVFTAIKASEGIYSFRISSSADDKSVPKLILSNHYGPSFSPDGKLLACMSYKPGGNIAKLVIFDTKTMREIASLNTPKDAGVEVTSFELPISWVSNEQFVVTEGQQKGYEITKKIKFFKITR